MTCVTHMIPTYWCSWRSTTVCCTTSHKNVSRHKLIMDRPYKTNKARFSLSKLLHYYNQTEKLTIESARQVRRWAVSAIEFSVNTTSIYLQNWRSTMPWFFPPSSMVVRCGHCIAGISRNWSSSTCKLSAPSWESGGRTTSPIWRSSIKLIPPA